MESTMLEALWHALTAATSRRRIVAGLAGGLLTTRSFASSSDDAAAKKHDKRNKKKRKDKKKRQNKNSPTTVTGTCSGPSFRINTSSDRRLAQTFVAQTSGPLVRATLELDQRPNEGAGDYILRLSPVDDDGVPTHQVLAESVVAGGDVPDGPSTIDFDFADQFALKTGIEYALVLARPDAEQFAWAGDLGDRCAGRLFFSADQTGEFRAFDPAVEGRFTAVVKT